MAGRIKHMERSHKTHNRNYSEFRSFTVKAAAAKNRKEHKKSIKDFINGLFHRHQDK